LDAVCGAIREAHTGAYDTALELLAAVGYPAMNVSELHAKANELYQKCVGYERVAGNLPSVMAPGRRGLAPTVALDERPRIDIGAMQAEAERRALAAAPPGAVERLAQLKQREKEEEARIARSLPRLAPVGPVATGNL
jgi:hypothetical protein